MSGSLAKLAGRRRSSAAHSTLPARLGAAILFPLAVRSPLRALAEEAVLREHEALSANGIESVFDELESDMTGHRQEQVRSRHSDSAHRVHRDIAHDHAWDHSQQHHGGPDGGTGEHEAGHAGSSAAGHQHRAQRHRRHAKQRHSQDDSDVDAMPPALMRRQMALANLQELSPDNLWEDEERLMGEDGDLAASYLQEGLGEERAQSWDFRTLKKKKKKKGDQTTTSTPDDSHIDGGDCRVEDWSDWGECSATCGDKGMMSRSRMFCPPSADNLEKETNPCSIKECPKPRVAETHTTTPDFSQLLSYKAGGTRAPPRLLFVAICAWAHRLI